MWQKRPGMGVPPPPMGGMSSLTQPGIQGAPAPGQASKGKKLPVKKSAPMPRGSGKPLINLQGMMNDGSA